ncbi:fibronectin type III domain-containing protein [Paenibacillus harenae]|uniref:RCC1 domain-containing protein n=1 Tax=Paenibacillus harenae TaxID=306543 RepID=UPI00040D9DC2|nr:fibronectin type III domain-containing protein [Paenibacillus harenae]
MKLRFMLLVYGFLMLTLLLPFQAAAAESVSIVEAESSKSGVTMVAGGSAHTLTLQNDRTVWAWGSNWNGELGDGTTNVRLTPIQVKDLEEVVAVAAGWGHSLALKEDGTVWAWGRNDVAQLGDGTTNNRLTPVQVQGLSSVVAISAGLNHNLALKSDGTVWAWGLNFSGQLGDGTRLNYRSVPVQVQGLDSVTAIAANGSHSLAVKADGTVWAWGSNVSGELGIGYSEENRLTPVQVQDLSSVIAVTAGLDHNLAIKSDGTVWAWGEIYFRQLEDGTDTISYTPVQVQGLSSVVAIASGSNHSLAVKSDDTFWVWGDNWAGQLGDGTRTARYTPVQVQGLGESSPEAPEWPSGDVLTVTDVTYNSVQLNWHPATDETGVDKYLVYQDNTLLDTLSGDVNSYEVKGLSPKTSYLLSLVAVDADDNQSVKKEVTATTAAYTAPVSFQLSDSKTYSYGGSIYEYSLYYGYVSSPGQVLSGSWTPPKGYHGVVKVSMGSPEGENYDLSLETVGEGNRLPEDTTILTNGTEYSAAGLPEGYTAEWRVKGHTDNDYSPDKKVFVYVSIKYDNH